MYLEAINDPGDLQSLDDAALEQLAAEIREFLVDKVSRTGGHLGPNLGIVGVVTEGYNQRGEIVISYRRTFMVYKRGHQPRVDAARPDESSLPSIGG